MEMHLSAGRSLRALLIMAQALGFAMLPAEAQSREVVDLQASDSQPDRRHCGRFVSCAERDVSNPKAGAKSSRAAWRTRSTPRPDGDVSVGPSARSFMPEAQMFAAGPGIAAMLIAFGALWRLRRPRVAFDSSKVKLVEQLEHALLAERSFSSMLVHELRSPLAGLRAQAQLASRARDDAECKQALFEVLHSVDRTSQVIDQLTEFVRVDRMPKDAVPVLAAVDVTQVLGLLLDDLRNDIRRRQVTVSCNFEQSLMQCWEPGLVVMLRNLLANAIRHSPEGGAIDIATWCAGGFVVMTVDDAGAGIAPDLRDSAFEPFNRLGMTEPDGVGLGLSLVKLVARRHGGDIELLDSPRGGLRARVRLPLQA